MPAVHQPQELKIPTVSVGDSFPPPAYNVPQRVREDKGNCCFQVCLPLTACLSLGPIIVYLLTWDNEMKQEYAEIPGIVAVLAVICFLICCCLPHLCKTSQSWRMYHTCPNCGKQLANVPTDAPMGAGQFYSVRNV